jgi:YVTN family beta-propeller protein
MIRTTLALILAATPALAQRTVGPQPDGSILASDNQLLTPAGLTVHLGAPVRAKAVAINPNAKTHSAAVLLMGAAQPVIIFNTLTGEMIQRFAPKAATGGAITGLAYSPDGTKLLFSQDTAKTTGGFVTIAAVDPANGTIAGATSLALPKVKVAGTPNESAENAMNPAGIALANGGATALVALNAQNTVGVIDVATAKLTSQIPVGNAPNHIAVIGTTAFVTNEGGRVAEAGDFTNPSDGTAIVSDPFDGHASTGTVSVIDLPTGRVTDSIAVGLRPAGIAVSGSTLYVANAYSDTISVIDAATKKVTKTISVAIPIQGGAFGAGADDIAVVGQTGYVTLGQSNAIAVLDLPSGQVRGYIPTLYFPTSIAYDAATQQLVVADDKGTGAQGALTTLHGATGFNTRQDAGTVSLIKLPDAAQLAALTKQVISNNSWDGPAVALAAATPDRAAKPVAIPQHAGEPSLIKHVFLVIKENRTYDQMLGDLPQGNGDPTLAIFAPNVPNQHALVRRFPLLDNMYAPSRQSADGHPWIVESGSFYSNDILSPDWVRSYPGGNSDDPLAYTQQGFLWSVALKAGRSVRLYGEWTTTPKIAKKPDGGTYSWADFYNTALYTETGGKQGAAIVPANTDTEEGDMGSTRPILDPHYPSFNLGIPDQYRADYYIAGFNAQVAANAVPDFTIIWLPDDHTDGITTGEPLPANFEADNDLALGRIIEAISHSAVWPSTAIFVEEDDAQNGVDHVDGHRQPVYVVSPYTVPPQAPGVGQVIHTLYTQENINRTIENILGLHPLTQFDLVASPMFDVFQNTPDTTPFTHVAATTALNIGPGGVAIAGTGAVRHAEASSPVEKAWNEASNAVMAGQQTRADGVDEAFLNHAIWYAATHFSRPYPGETAVQMPEAFLPTGKKGGD